MPQVPDSMPSGAFDQVVRPLIMDSDSHETAINGEEGRVRVIANMQPGPPAERGLGRLVTMRSSLPLPIPAELLPAGDNNVVGLAEDRSLFRLYAFLQNSNNDHTVFRFLEREQRWQKVYQSRFLDFVAPNFICQTRFAIPAGKYPTWSDDFNPPRSIDAERGVIDGKRREWQVLMGRVGENIYGAGYAINLSVGGIGLGDIYTSIGDAALGQTVDVAEDVADALNALALFTASFSAVAIANTIIVTENVSEGAPAFQIVATAAFGAITKPWPRIVAYNFYDAASDEQAIDAVRWPLGWPPEVTLITDRNRPYNLIAPGFYQARRRYRHIDGTYSAWGPWSVGLYFAGGCGAAASNLDNGMRISLEDPLFGVTTLRQKLQLVDAIEVAIREGNSSPMVRVQTIPRADIGAEYQYLDYYGDSITTSVSLREDLQPYDYLPLRAGTISTVGLKEQARILFADILERFNDPTPDMRFVGTTFHPAAAVSDNGKVIGKIIIHNTAAAAPFSNRGQPIFSDPDSILNFPIFGGDADDLFPPIGILESQLIPLGGFAVYCAGTPNYGVSVQDITTGAPGYLIVSDPVHNVLDLAAESANIIADMAGDGLVQNFEIIAPPGTYIIRIASHFVSFGDVLDKGSIYDLLQPDQAWQGTSTYVSGAHAGAPNAALKNNGVFELVVTVLPSATTDAGTFWVADHIDRNPFIPVVKPTAGYVVDVSDSIVNKFAPRAEKQLVTIDSGGGILGSALTDHNGYAHFGINYGLLYGALLAVHSVKGTEAAPQLVKPYAQSMIGGGLKYLMETGLVPPLVDSNIIPITNLGEEFVVLLTDTRMVNCRTHIEGFILDDDDLPVAGVLTQLTGTGRKSISDGTGFFRLLAYGQGEGTASEDERRGDLVFGTAAGCIITFDDGPVEPIIIEDFGDVYNFGSPYDAGVYRMSMAREDAQAYLQNGGKYRVAVLYADRASRTGKLLTQNTLELAIPFTTQPVRDFFPTLVLDSLGGVITPETQANGFITTSLRLRHKPPIWATHMYVCMTQNALQINHLTIPVNDVLYVRMFTESTDPLGVPTEPLVTTYETGLAAEVYLDLLGAMRNHRSINTASTIGWDFEPGDRLRLIRRNTGELYPDTKDVPIRGIRGEKNYFVIENQASLERINPGAMVQIYRPKKSAVDDLDVFWEIGKAVKILNPYTVFAEHEEVTIDLAGLGDTHRRRRVISVTPTEASTIVGGVSYIVEDPKHSDSATTINWGRGRPRALDPDFKQLRRVSAMRLSDPLVTGTQINGLATVAEDTLFETGTEDGPITIAHNMLDVLFVAQHHKCHTRLVGKARVQQSGAGELIVDSSTLLDNPYFLDDQVGCQNPESAAIVGDSAYFYDDQNGCAINYAQHSGLIVLSGWRDKYESTGWIDALMDERRAAHKPLYSQYAFLVRVWGAFDRVNREYILLFAPITASQNQLGNTLGNHAVTGDDDPQLFSVVINPTAPVNLPLLCLAYSRKAKGWRKYTYAAKLIAQVGDIVVGANGDAIELLYQGTDYLRAFGQDLEAEVRIVFNVGPDQEKTLQALRVASNRPWSAAEAGDITTSPHSQRPTGQSSMVPDQAWLPEDRHYVAPVYGNVFDPRFSSTREALLNGEKIMGRAFEIRLVQTSHDQSYLEWVSARVLPIP